jgi:eukaryotic-like serine/threonine-protein kinase
MDHSVDPPALDVPTDGLGDRARAAADEVVDHLARSVAKARIASALFARDRRIAIGRYQLLERVGAGGMGVVWGAWDPELERRVAIKLVKPTVHAARERIVREGQALAKLSHPNIVQIFDVGMIDDQVYLVMEWVRGVTLRRFGEVERTRRELLEVYHQAGAGLAAAHRAGVIHRDFKPDNAIYGEDGRVRVLDFGLAQGADRDREAGTTAPAGTPRYMAPEQASGDTLTTAVDQYAFCVSLREALTSERAHRPPRWLTAIIERGTSDAPALRFLAMGDLLAALSRDPVKVWRRRGLTAAALMIASGAFLVGRAQSGVSGPARCVGAQAEIVRSWDPSARAAMIEHLRGLGPFGANEGERLAGELDAYSSAWVGERTRACASHERGELPTAVYERRVSCLARAEASLAAVVRLMTTVESNALGSALIAARSLPNASGCLGEDGAAVAPPAAAIATHVMAVAREVERARVLGVAASPNAVEVADAAVIAARATNYEPLIVRAQLMQGWARAHVDRAAARDLLFAAFHGALQVGNDVLAVEIYARARWVASRFAEFRPVEEERQIVEDIARRNGSSHRFGLALLYNNLGSERLVAADRRGAREQLRQALTVWQPPIGDRAQDIELVAILRNLALVEDDPRRRVELSSQAATSYEQVLGREHPAAISARIQEAVLTLAPADAARKFAATCGGIPSWHARLVAGCAYEQGWLAIDRGDLESAVAAMQRAEGDPRDSTRRSQDRIASAYLAVASRDPRRSEPAIVEMQELAAKLSQQEGWWNRADAADALAVVAIGANAAGRIVASTEAWTNSLSLIADQPVLERRLARARATVAVRLAKRKPAEARALAQLASNWYATATGYDDDVQRMQSVLDPGPP